MSLSNLFATEEFVYKFNNEGFFGYSLEQDFFDFSFWHFLPIIILCAAIFFTYRYREKIKGFKHEETLRFVLAAVILLNEFAYFWRLLYVGRALSGDQLITYLPLEVCQWSAFLCAFMLMKKSKHLFDICFYICLSLGLLPLFTPAVIHYTGPSYFRYYQFWLEHILPIYAVFYMLFVMGYKPDFKKIWKPYCALAVLATFAIIANLNIEGANFMYLADTTDGSSLANILPPSIPLRLVIGFGLVTVLFALLSIPQIVRLCKTKKKA